MNIQPPPFPASIRQPITRALTCSLAIRSMRSCVGALRNSAHRVERAHREHGRRASAVQDSAGTWRHRGGRFRRRPGRLAGAVAQLGS